MKKMILCMSVLVAGCNEARVAKRVTMRVDTKVDTVYTVIADKGMMTTIKNGPAPQVGDTLFTYWTLR